MTNPETSAPTGAIVAVSGNDTGGAIQDLAGMYAGRTWYSSPSTATTGTSTSASVTTG